MHVIETYVLLYIKALKIWCQYDIVIWKMLWKKITFYEIAIKDFLKKNWCSVIFPESAVGES